MTKREQKLVASLRPDVAVNCVPRRTNLPKGAVRAIECFPTIRSSPASASTGSPR